MTSPGLAAASVVADFYLLATVVLLGAWAAMCFVPQPVRRITVAWGTVLGLALLAATSSLPTWPRLSLASAWHPGNPAADASVAVKRAQRKVPDRAPTVSDLPERKAHSGGARKASGTASDVSGQRVPSTIATRPGTLGRFSETESPAFGSPIVAPVTRPNALNSDRIAVGFVMLFCVCAGVVGMWLALGVVHARSLRAKAMVAPETLCLELAQIMGHERPIPRLLVSPGIHSAVALGILRPTILLPSKAAAEPASDGLRAALAHELAHIRNRDLWLLSAGRCLLLLLFAHPLFWILRRRIRDDQELLADAAAASRTSRGVYTRGLLSWARLCVSGPSISPALAIWESRSQLKRRITMLLDDSLKVETDSSRVWRCGTYAICGLPVLVLSTLALLRTTPAAANSKSHPQAATATAAAEPQAEEHSTEAPSSDVESVANDNAKGEEESGPEVLTEPDDPDAIAALEQLGASLQKNEGGNVTVVRFQKPIENLDDLVPSLMGLPMLEGLGLRDTGLADSDLACLKGLPAIKRLWLSGSQFTDAGIVHLKGLPGLRSLFLGGEDVDDEKLLLLEKLPELESLNVYHSRVTPDGFKPLARLPKLVSLTVSNLPLERSSPDTPQFTDEALLSLASKKSFKRLNLSFGTRITDVGMAHLANFPGLEALQIRSDQVTDAGLAHLSELKDLKELDFATVTSSLSRRLLPRAPRLPQFTDAGLKHLSGLTKLERLHLSNSRFSDAGMVHLQGMVNLKSLFLSRASVTEDGLKHLRGLKDLESLYLSSSVWTDAALEELKNLSKLRNMSLRDLDISDSGLSVLASMTNITRLDLGEARITDDGLKHVSRMTQLQSLDLGRKATITDAGMAHLSGLENLNSLQLSNTFVTDDGLRHLEGLPNLRSISIFGGRISGIGFETLPHLDRLVLNGTGVTDQGLKSIAKHKNLESLWLSDAREITDAGIEALAGLSRLRSLNLGRNPQLTDTGIAHLRQLGNLTNLHLDDAQLTDDGLEHLAELSGLEWLSLRSTRITDAGLVHLKKLGKLTHLTLGRTRISDEGLVHLEGLKNLGTLSVQATLVTSEGVKRLKKALPKCRIRT